MAALLEELKRRNVFRVAVGYLVLAWVVLQITDLVAPALHLPEWTLSLVTFLGIIGFPFALFFAWAFELTPDGLKRSEDVTPEDSITGQTAGSLNKLIIALLGLAVVILLLDRLTGFSQSEPQAPQATATQGTATAPQPEQQVSTPRSIAVLPFVNMSGDQEQEYFSDGISEELLNALAQIRELRVAARTSSFAFKGKNQDITEIGAKLNVETVLEGSVRKAGTRVRITAQLINVEDGYHLWSDTYDRELIDIFAVQDEISAAIVAALKLHLTDQPRAAARQVDIAAYNFLLQARHNVRLRNEEALELAVRQYRQALDIESDYPEALAGLAIATLLLSDGSYGDIPVVEANAAAQGYLDRAFALAPELWEAHAGQALLYMDAGGDLQAGLIAIDRALQQNASEGYLYLWKANLLDSSGQFRLATETIERAYKTDPLHPAIQMRWANRLVLLDRGDEARALLTPGTAAHYLVEFEIAARQGQVAASYKLLQEAEIAYPAQAELYRRIRGMQMVYGLFELREALSYAKPHHQDLIHAWLDPQETVDRLHNAQAAQLELADLEVLLAALMQLDRCDEVVPLLAHLDLEGETALAVPDGGHTRSSFVFPLAWCLNQTGQTERGHRLGRRMMAVLEQARERGLPALDLMNWLVFSHVLVGDPSAAMALIEEDLDSGGSWYFDFHYAPYLAALVNEPGYSDIRRRSLEKLNSDRAELGLSPIID